MSREPTDPGRVALLGCGGIAAYVGMAIKGGLAGGWKVVSVFDHDISERALALSDSLGTPLAPSVAEMLRFRPDVVLEAAGPDAVRQHALSIIEAGSDLIMLSSGALVDQSLLSKLRHLAVRHGRRIYIPSGALAGLDLVQAAAVSRHSASVRLVTRKPPVALAGAPFLRGRSVPSDRASIVFSGSVAEAAAGFPANTNVAVSLSLAIGCSDRVEVQIESDPDLSVNTHEVIVTGDFGSAVANVSSVPVPGNPRSSLLAALSAIALLRRIRDPLWIG